MAVILYDDFRMFVLDRLGELSEQCRLTDTSHILETDFCSTCRDKLVGDCRIIFHGVYRRSGDTECGLWCHSCLKSPLDARDDVSHVVESAEDTGDVNTLGVLYLILKCSHIVRHRIHTQSVKTAVEHVSLYTHLIEWLTECSYCRIRIFAGEKVDLFKSSSVGLHTREASHLDYHRSDALQLIFARLELARRLPHVSVYETELDFLFHFVFDLKRNRLFLADIQNHNYYSCPTVLSLLRVFLFCKCNRFLGIN